MAPDTLAVFDVDGTLLSNGTAVRTLFFKAFEETTGVKPEKNGICFAGQTDRGIMRKLLVNNGVDGVFEDRFHAFETCFEEMVEDVYFDHPDPIMLPGVEELLDELTARKDVAMVLGTGNCRGTCFTKLRRFALDHYFSGGGFGGDHEVRSDAIQAALDDGRKQESWTGEVAWVIGDTVNDIRAARAVGAKSLCVATGPEAYDNLVAGEPDALLRSLRDTSEVLRAMNLEK